MTDLVAILTPVAVGAIDGLLGGFIGAGTGYLMRKTVRSKVKPEDFQNRADYEAAFKKEADKVAWVGTIATVGASCAVGAVSADLLMGPLSHNGGHHGGENHHNGGHHGGVVITVNKGGGNSSSTSTGSSTTTTTVDPDVAEVAGE